ncbi:MAG: LamG domain-containing protein, partial [Sedimentisphaerales bacterium]|nr:LamG domain-containing protein [Sedimentisphaerales bacterium]
DLHTDSNNPPYLNGALTFNGTSDYINLGNIIGTGAYTKAAWIRRDDSETYNNIISSGDPQSHAFYAPTNTQFKLTAWHAPYSAQYIAQDPNGLAPNVWYFVAVTYDPNVDSGTLVLYKDGDKVDDVNHVPTLVSSPNTYIGRFTDGTNGYWMKGAIDNAMVFNRALTEEEIASLYNKGKGTEELSTAGGQCQVSYTANGWHFDVNENFEVKVDYHYSGISASSGWIGLNVGDDSNSVSISVGSDGNQPYFYYEAVVEGDVVSEREPRASNDGTLYVSFDSTLKEFYLSHTGFGSEYAYTAWTDPNPTQSQWSQPAYVIVGGGSSGATINPGEAYIDNFEMAKAGLMNWPPATDLDENGYIELYDLSVICENWLENGPGDIDNNGYVDFVDLAELGLAW